MSCVWLVLFRSLRLFLSDIHSRLPLLLCVYLLLNLLDLHSVALFDYLLLFLVSLVDFLLLAVLAAAVLILTYCFSEKLLALRYSLLFPIVSLFLVLAQDSYLLSAKSHFQMAPDRFSINYLFWTQRFPTHRPPEYHAPDLTHLHIPISYLVHIVHTRPNSAAWGLAVFANHPYLPMGI